MSDLNDALKDSYIGKVADALQPYTEELKAARFDPTSRIAQLGRYWRMRPLVFSFVPRSQAWCGVAK